MKNKAGVWFCPSKKTAESFTRILVDGITTYNNTLTEVEIIETALILFFKKIDRYGFEVAFKENSKKTIDI